jgi:hypothetical protein
MRFSVKVYDADVEDEMEMRVLVDGRSIRTEQWPQTGRPDREPYEVCIDLSELERKCSHVEILASSQFTDPQGNRDVEGTREPQDIDRIEWWVLGKASEYAEVGVSECQGKGEEQ